MYTIAIIDDEKWIRKLIKKLLPTEQFPITIIGEAEDGQEGLELLRKCRPHIVITDIRMPLLSGLDLIQSIQNTLPQSEIIIISGYDNFEYAQKAIKLGVMDFLMKPVEEAELHKAVGNAVRKLDIRNKQALEKSNLQRKVKRLTTDFVQLDSGDFSDIKNKKVRQALQYIREHFSEPISLTSVCDAVVINQSYFSEIFKKEMGIGFNHYLQNLRIEQAATLLLERPDLAVNDIAGITGFQDPNYFCRVFKKHFDVTAQEYRDDKQQGAEHGRDNCI
jgi:two-component system response regulator YesN